jgi:hypothetical protein
MGTADKRKVIRAASCFALPDPADQGGAGQQQPSNRGWLSVRASLVPADDDGRQRAVVPAGKRGGAYQAASEQQSEARERTRQVGGCAGGGAMMV